MTGSDPTPEDGKQPYPFDRELEALLKREFLDGIESATEDQLSREREDKILGLLLEDNFPLLSYVLELRQSLGIVTGLTEVYDRLRSTADSLSDSSDSSEESSKVYQLIVVLRNLIFAIQRLAAAIGVQESGLDVRKEAEAQLLLDKSIGRNFAERILQVVAPLFRGESLLPINEKSEEFLLFYQLEVEASDERRTKLLVLTRSIQEELSQRFTEDQLRAPNFRHFAFHLSIAIAQILLAPNDDSIPDSVYLDVKIKPNVTDAIKYGEQLGLNPYDVSDVIHEIVRRLR
jgi:hypothetical protein